MKQQFTILYDTNFHGLKSFIQQTIKEGFEISVVTNIGELHKIKLYKLPITDWLVIFRKVEGECIHEQQVAYIKDLADPEEKITYKSVFEAVRNYQAEFMPELDIENEVKPGLFLTAEQMEQLLDGDTIEIQWANLEIGLGLVIH